MTPNEARQILGVSSTATQDEIKQAWKDLAFSFHPDRAGVGNEARRKRLEEKLKEVNVAYDTLKSVTPKTKRTKKQTKKTKQTDREKNTDKTWKEYEKETRKRREKESEDRKKQKAREEHDKQVRQRAEEERKRREKEKQAKQKRKAQIILLVIAVLSTIIITNPLNFGVNEVSVSPVDEEIEQEIEAPDDPAPPPPDDPAPPEPEKLELLPISKFILTGNSGDSISDADCTIFERKFDLNQEDAIYFGRYDEFRCAKAIIVFDLADLQNKILTEQAEIKDNVISFEQIENPIEPFRCNGINLHPNDRHDPPNCNHTNDYAFELKFKFSNDPNCGPPNETFTELESWDKAVDWSNTTNNLNIYDAIISKLFTGQYLCLAFSEEGTDKTGDRHQYFRLYALTDLKINVFFADEDS